jgi:hypothetical protein
MGEMGFFGKIGEKLGYWGFGRPAVSGLTGEWPAVVLWWWVRRWVVLGVGGFGFREERTEEGGLRVCCTAERKMRGMRGKKGDLKAGLDGPKIEYVRTYICTFERTRAGACVCEAACVRTYASTFERTRAVQWVCEWRCGRTSPRRGWTQRSARSNVQAYVRTSSVTIFFLFLQTIKTKSNQIKSK